MSIEMRVPSYEDVWRATLDITGEQMLEQREAGHRALQSGLANALVRFAWAGVAPKEMQRIVTTTALRMILWTVDPEQGALTDAKLFGSDIEVRRGDA